MANKASVDPINNTVKVNQSAPGKSKPTQVLPTFKTSFDKQVHLLKAYANAYLHFGRPIKTEEVATVAKMPSTTISTANAFFLDVGLIQKNENGFVPSDALAAFNHALEWNPDSATSKLVEIFQNTWFVKLLIPKLMMSSISENEAITELASACSAGKEYKGQIKALLDYMIWTGLIRRDGDLIFKGGVAVPNTASKLERAENLAPSEPAKDSLRIPPTPMGSMTAGAIQFSINVKVDIAEMSGWSGEQISSFFTGLAQVLAAKAAIERYSA